MQQISQDEDYFDDDSYQSEYSDEEDIVHDQYDDGVTSEDPFDILVSQQKSFFFEKEFFEQPTTNA